MRRQNGGRGFAIRATACAALTGLAALGIAGHDLGGVVVAHAAAPASAAKFGDVVIGGVRWHGSLAKARAVAAQENRPVVLLSLFGRLDQEFC